MLTSVLRTYVKSATNDNIKYFLLVWFVANGIVRFAEKLTGIKLGIETYYFAGFIGYYVLGYYLNSIDIEKKNRIIIYIMASVGGILTMFGTYVLTQDKGKFVDTFNSYLSPNMIVMSIGIFVFVKNIDWNNIVDNNYRLNRLISDMSSLSFGIYLAHVIILELVKPFRFYFNILDPILGVPIVSIVIVLICYVIIKLMKSLPIIDNVVS